MTLDKFWELTKIILPLLTSIGCFVFSISSLILTNKNEKLKTKIDSIKYWINSIDKDELIKISPHDARYLEEAKKILKDT